MTDSGYLFDNQAEHASGRFDALASVFDPVTVRHLERLGMTDGSQCLEVGAGGGSIARWLAGRVGASGHVLATDIDVRWLKQQRNGPNVDVRQHDLVADPLPPDQFDLVHERLVLLHVPEREAVLSRLVAALRPGGRILVEDFDDTLTIDCIDPQSAGEELGNRIIRAVRTLLSQRGADVSLGHKLPGLLRAQGLVDVGADAYQAIDLGEAPRRLQQANIAQVADQLVEQQLVARDDLDRYLDALDRGEVRPSSPVLVSAWGTRPNR